MTCINSTDATCVSNYGNTFWNSDEFWNLKCLSLMTMIFTSVIVCCAKTFGSKLFDRVHQNPENLEASQKTEELATSHFSRLTNNDVSRTPTNVSDNVEIDNRMHLSLQNNDSHQKIQQLTQVFQLSLGDKREVIIDKFRAELLSQECDEFKAKEILNKIDSLIVNNKELPLKVLYLTIECYEIANTSVPKFLVLRAECQLKKNVELENFNDDRLCEKIKAKNCEFLLTYVFTDLEKQQIFFQKMRVYMSQLVSQIGEGLNDIDELETDLDEETVLESDHVDNLKICCQIYNKILKSCNDSQKIVWNKLLKSYVTILETANSNNTLDALGMGEAELIEVYLLLIKNKINLNDHNMLFYMGEIDKCLNKLKEDTDDEYLEDYFEALLVTATSLKEIREEALFQYYAKYQEEILKISNKISCFMFIENLENAINYFSKCNILLPKNLQNYVLELGDCRKKDIDPKTSRTLSLILHEYARINLAINPLTLERNGFFVQQEKTPLRSLKFTDESEKFNSKPIFNLRAADFPCFVSLATQNPEKYGQDYFDQFVEIYHNSKEHTKVQLGLALLEMVVCNNRYKMDDVEAFIKNLLVSIDEEIEGLTETSEQLMQNNCYALLLVQVQGYLSTKNRQDLSEDLIMKLETLEMQLRDYSNNKEFYNNFRQRGAESCANAMVNGLIAVKNFKQAQDLLLTMFNKADQFVDKSHPKFKAQVIEKKLEYLWKLLETLKKENLCYSLKIKNRFLDSNLLREIYVFLGSLKNKPFAIINHCLLNLLKEIYFYTKENDENKKFLCKIANSNAFPNLSNKIFQTVIDSHQNRGELYQMFS